MGRFVLVLHSRLHLNRIAWIWEVRMNIMGHTNKTPEPRYHLAQCTHQASTHQEHKTQASPSSVLYCFVWLNLNRRSIKWKTERNGKKEWKKSYVFMRCKKAIICEREREKVKKERKARIKYATPNANGRRARSATLSPSPVWVWGGVSGKAFRKWDLHFRFEWFDTLTTPQ